MDETPANRVPDNIVCAARRGDTEAVRRWLESGGDPNWDLVDPNSHGATSTYRLLLLTTGDDQRDVMRLLISHGADVQYVHYFRDDPPDRALDVAIYNDKTEAALLLLDNGADVSRLNWESWAAALGNCRLLRIVLAAGADFTACSMPGGLHGRTPEVFARHDGGAIIGGELRVVHEESVSILEGARLAGSYKQYVLQDYKHLLRLRSLLARGRALLGSQTPEVVKRLFGGRVDAWATFPHQRLVGVPDPAFWLVMEYWRLGNWRRP